VIHVDTSALIDSLTGPRRSLPKLTALVADGHRLTVSTLVYYEWRRGPRSARELAALDALIPQESIVSLTVEMAVAAADLYRATARPRGREIDLAIAACALVQGAALWTLNHADFKDIPNLRLV
jgi:predicted nucleic acid-binding protein